MAAEASPSVTDVFPTPPFWLTMATIAPMPAMLPRWAGTAGGRVVIRRSDPATG